MSKKTDIWMPLVIGDYLKDTQHLDATRHGCYLLWLMHYWTKGPLPNSIEEVIWIGKLRGEHAPSIAQALLSEFFTLGSDGRWHQKRADAEKNRWHDKQQKQQDKAKKAADTRWGNGASSNAPSIPTSNAHAVHNSMLNGCPSPSPSSSPSSLPSPSPPPPGEKAPRSGPGGGNGASPAAGLFNDEAQMLATAVTDETGLTGWQVRDQIVKQAERQFRLSADKEKPVTKEILLPIMVKNWKLYDACTQADRIRLPVTPERFFSDGLWKNLQKWGFKKGMTADGIDV